MKAILFFLAGMFVFSGPAQAADLDNDYSLGCEMTLIGPMATATTDIKYAAPTKMIQGPNVAFDLGDYVLAAYGSATSYQKAPAAPVYEPNVEVTLYKKAEGPIAGQVNVAGLRALTGMQVSDTRTTYSRSFLQLKYAGQTFSRIDYSCSITRVK